MADNTNPNGGKTSSSELLPKYYRTDSNKKFLQATIDQLIQPGTVKKVNGMLGEKILNQQQDQTYLLMLQLHQDKTIN
jgi:hypothetical protein